MTGNKSLVTKELRGFFFFAWRRIFGVRSTKRSTTFFSICRKGVAMASIYPNRKEGKIVPFKFKKEQPVG